MCSGFEDQRTKQVGSLLLSAAARFVLDYLTSRLVTEVMKWKTA